MIKDSHVDGIVAVLGELLGGMDSDMAEAIREKLRDGAVFRSLRDAILPVVGVKFADLPESWRRRVHQVAKAAHVGGFVEFRERFEAVAGAIGMRLEHDLSLEASGARGALSGLLALVKEFKPERVPE